MAAAKKPANTPQRPVTFEELVDDKTVTPEEAAALDGEDGDVAAEPAPGGHQIPDWVVLPPDLKLPPAGREVGFIRIRAKLTATPSAGDRQCIVWPLTDADEKLAFKRMRGENARVVSEQTKGMIRAVDGHRVTWGTGDAGDIERWWNEVGPRGRKLLQAAFLQMHSVSEEDQLDFFTNCMSFRSTAAD